MFPGNVDCGGVTNTVESLSPEAHRHLWVAGHEGEG